MICGRRALPIYWVLLDKKGSRDFGEQKKFLKPVLRLLKPYPLVVMGDREFQGVQLGKCLDDRGLAFILRQKKSTYTRWKESENYQALSELEPNRGSHTKFNRV
jgi:hypothetical protein